MRYFYDTEFKEDGKVIDFISIGIVAEDGREYYAVSNEFDTRRVAKDNWLMENVMSSIAHDQFIVYDFWGKPAVRDIFVTDPAARSREKIKFEVWDFLTADGDRPELWAWYSAYDHVCLAQLWGKMIDLPQNMSMRTNDIATLVDLAGLKPSDVPRQPEGLHNSLQDARWNKVRHDFLMERLNGAQS